MYIFNRIWVVARNRENYLTTIEMISLIEMIEPQKRKATQCLILSIFHSLTHSHSIWIIQHEQLFLM